MPTLADIYSAINTAKRKGADFVQNPGTSLQQMLGNANDRARDFNQLNDQALAEMQQTGKLTGPAGQQLMQTIGQALEPVGMTVYHGSPYKFNKFDASKIGSGEGAQVYGHGIYVAENPKVAADYMKIEPAGAVASPRRTLLGSEVETGTPEYKVAQLVDEMGLSKARKFILDWSKNPNPDQVEFVGKASDVIQKLTKKGDAKNLGTGSMYKIDLPDEHIEQMLDWDKPLSQQHPNVQKAIKNSNVASLWKEQIGHDIEKSQPQADFVYKTIAEKLGSQQAASNYFKELGIPGIKYFDEKSRAAKKGTRNFVVFPGNESLLKIQDINGNPIK